jgi:hypothetical protein
MTHASPYLPGDHTGTTAGKCRSRKVLSTVLHQHHRSFSTNRMEALQRLLGVTPSRRFPPLVESDDIYPVHMLDDTKTLRSIVVTWTLCFNDVLDAQKLHASLSRLLEIGDWKKVGGRLRLNVSGLYDICDRSIRSKAVDSRPLESWKAGNSRSTALHLGTSCSVLHSPIPSCGY